MWTSWDRSYQARGFSTPPPSAANSRSWRSPAIPHSAPSKRNSDVFHVIHKVPAGDSPYVKAKHVQLIDKDPSKAISLFWAAINSGDRVDSALKDMAVVMKQLDRSDEAIEAIKSFRHLCPHESQEPLDNILLELYKRCGRIEDQIKMLEIKVKRIEEGFNFGKRVKPARSQGKKIYMTLEQEYSRLLGNLAWAYMQKNDFKSAEEHYRKALSLEADRNKQCNLAICLMNMKRITEAKLLLHTIKSPSYKNGSLVDDESYARSLERATEMLAQLECPGGAHRELLTPVLQTQPRKCSSGLINGGDKRRYFLRDDGKCARKLAFGENCDSSRVEKENEKYFSKTETKKSWADENGMKIGVNVEKENGNYFSSKSWTDENIMKNGENAEKENGNYFLPPKSKERWADENSMKKGVNVEKENGNYSLADENCKKNEENAVKENGNYFLTPKSKKSWADMVEDEEKESPFPFQTQPREGFKNENLDSCIGEIIGNSNLVLSLVNFVEGERVDEYHDCKNGMKMLKSGRRLQVFRDITGSSKR